MNRGLRTLCVWLTAVLAVIAVGCAHKPAYSDIDANRAANNQNQNKASESQPATSIPSAAVQPDKAPAPTTASPTTASPTTAAPTTSAAPTTAAATASPAVQNPSFLNPRTGGIKDLPSYPGAQRLRVQFGPDQGFNTMSLILATRDQMPKITAFYETVIKANQWSVSAKIIDPEFSEWNLKKGDTQTAQVQIKKDPGSRLMNIILARTEKLEPSSK